MAEGFSHTPVMLAEVLEALQPKDGEVYVDGTFGGGGYTRAILEAANCHVIAVDQDPDAILRGQALKDEFEGRLTLVQGNFGALEDRLRAAGVDKVDAIILDLGVSSYQLDDGTRGFSFRHDGPLDMRMAKDQAGETGEDCGQVGGKYGGQSAADLVNTLEESALSDIIYSYGEERHARKIAKAILKARAEAPITTTTHLATLIKDVIPGFSKTHPATKTFQALRIAVNDELGALESVLDQSLSLLNEGGRLIVVSFHSLEDRIVKTFLDKYSGYGEGGSRYAPAAQGNKVAAFSVPKRKAGKPSKQEESENTRARSARLRYGIRMQGGAS